MAPNRRAHCRCRYSSWRQRRRTRAAEADPNSTAAQLAGTPIGQIAGMLNSVRPARDVIFEMVEQYAAAIERLDALGM